MGKSRFWDLASVKQLQAAQIPAGLHEEGRRILWTLHFQRSGIATNTKIPGTNPVGAAGMHGEQSPAWPPPPTPPGFAFKTPSEFLQKDNPTVFLEFPAGFFLTDLEASPAFQARQAGKCCQKQELQLDPALLSPFPELFLG